MAIYAAEFRTELDKLLAKYGARMVLGWYGKTSKLQVQFPEQHETRGVTIIEVQRNGRVRYRTEVEDNL